MIEHAKYRPSYNISTAEPIANAVPLDFNLDGHLDVLVLTQDQVEDGGWWGTKRTILNGEIYLGGGENGGFRKSFPCGQRCADATDTHIFSFPIVEAKTISIDPITTLQPTIIDSTGRLRPDFLALSSESRAQSSKLQLFANSLSGFNA